MDRRRWLAVAAAAAASGCARVPRPALVPMPVLRVAAGCGGAAATTLLVLLPGIASLPQEFVDEGFVAALRERGIAADVAAADSHFGYFQDRSVLDRLRADVVLPARAAGYRSVWLVGISLGGFAALGYPLAHPDEVDGVLVLAPYLGERPLLQEIAAGGGARRWAAATPPDGIAALDRAIWQRYAGQPPPTPVYLGWGDGDGFADSARAFGALLPAGRTLQTSGGHDWRAWRRLWSAWLDRGLLPVLPGGCR